MKRSLLIIAIAGFVFAKADSGELEEPTETTETTEPSATEEPETGLRCFKGTVTGNNNKEEPELQYCGHPDKKCLLSVSGNSVRYKCTNDPKHEVTTVCNITDSGECACDTDGCNGCFDVYRLESCESALEQPTEPTEPEERLQCYKGTVTGENNETEPELQYCAHSEKKCLLAVSGNSVRYRCTNDPKHEVTTVCNITNSGECACDTDGCNGCFDVYRLDSCDGAMGSYSTTSTVLFIATFIGYYLIY